MARDEHDDADPMLDRTILGDDPGMPTAAETRANEAAAAKEAARVKTESKTEIPRKGHRAVSAAWSAWLGLTRRGAGTGHDSRKCCPVFARDWRYFWIPQETAV